MASQHVKVERSRSRDSPLLTIAHPFEYDQVTQVLHFDIVKEVLHEFFQTEPCTKRREDTAALASRAASYLISSIGPKLACRSAPDEKTRHDGAREAAATAAAASINDFSNDFIVLTSSFQGRIVFLRETAKPIRKSSIVFEENPIIEVKWSHEEGLLNFLSTMDLEHYEMYFAAWVSLQRCSGAQRKKLESRCVPDASVVASKRALDDAKTVLKRLEGTSWNFKKRSMTADKFRSYALLWKYNCWKTDEGLGVYDHACTLSHSCYPNCEARVDDSAGNAIRIYALQAIKPGEELTVTYLDDTELAWPTERRKKKLLDAFGFVCSCRKCTMHSPARPFNQSKSSGVRI